MSVASTSRHGSKQLASLCGPMRRAYSTTTPCLAETSTESQKPPAADLPDPATAFTHKELKTLRKAGVNPIGSFRRRIAIRTTANIPFELLPYQCFQEARKVLASDREVKLRQIEVQRKRIAILEGKIANSPNYPTQKRGTLMEMRRHLEQLKILADINDPEIKKRFEDGQGDMSKPIYRHLADTKWRSYNRKILMQRLETMHVVPDVFSGLNPTISVSLAFRQHPVTPGELVPSILSVIPPALRIQVFDQGPRYYTIAVINPDVPNTETDAFDNRCHFLATNILVDPTQPLVALSRLAKEHVVIDWLPPHAQKGSPYHRMCLFVFEQSGREDAMARPKTSDTDSSTTGKIHDVEQMKAKLRDSRGWSASGLASKFRLRPVGAHMFRTVWDEWTAQVMQKHNLPGADIEFKRKRGEKSPPKKRDTERYR